MKILDPSNISKALEAEAKQIRRVLRCARGALKVNPKNKEAQRCLKLADAKLKLVKKLQERHEGL